MGIEYNRKDIVGHRAGILSTNCVIKSYGRAKALGTRDCIVSKKGYFEPHELVVYSNARAPVDFVCKTMNFVAARPKQSVLLRKNPPCMITF